MTEPLRIPLFDAKPPQEPEDRRERAAGTVVSLLGHILLLVLFIGLGGHKAVADVFDLGAGDGIGAGPAGGGGGGGSEAPVIVTAVEEPPPAEPEPEVKPPEVIPPDVIPLVEPEIKPVEIPPVAAVVDTMPKVAAVTPTGGSGGGQNAGSGPGTGPGTGPGSGGGSGGGEGGGIGSGFGPGTGRGRVMAPSPEVLLIPPPAPGSVRGKEVIVRLSVDSTGVVRDAEIIPSTGDRKYDSALKRVALGWRFRAARDPENKPVAVQFDVTFKF